MTRGIQIGFITEIKGIFRISVIESERSEAQVCCFLILKRREVKKQVFLSWKREVLEAYALCLILKGYTQFRRKIRWPVVRNLWVFAEETEEYYPLETWIFWHRDSLSKYQTCLLSSWMSLSYMNEHYPCWVLLICVSLSLFFFFFFINNLPSFVLLLVCQILFHKIFFGWRKGGPNWGEEYSLTDIASAISVRMRCSWLIEVSSLCFIYLFSVHCCLYFRF